MNQLAFRLQRKLKHIFRSHFGSQEFIYQSKFGFRIKLNYTKDVDRFFYWGQFELNNIEFFRKIIPKQATILDVGANIGIYSLISSIATGKNGQVHAFEPADIAYNSMCENISLNGITNIFPNKLGVADKSGVLDFYICEDDAYNSLGKKPMTAVKKKEQITVTSLDDYCAKKAITKVDIIKIDTEGADYLVLKGAEKILSQKEKPIIFSEYNIPTEGGFSYSNADFYTYIVSCGYNVYYVNEKELFRFNPEKDTNPEIICLTDSHIKALNLHPVE